MARNAKTTASREAERSELIDGETGEIIPGPGVGGAMQTMNGFGQIDRSNLKIKSYVSTPMIEVPEGVSFIAQMVDACRPLPPLEGVKPKYTTPHFASTIKAPNGEVRLITWTAVLKSEIERAYPDGSYVGKWFQITKLPKKKGKDYSAYAIAEVEFAA